MTFIPAKTSVSGVQLFPGLVVLAGGALYERHGYFAVTTVCAVMTAVVAILLATHIVEPRSAPRDAGA